MYSDPAGSGSFVGAGVNRQRADFRRGAIEIDEVVFEVWHFVGIEQIAWHLEVVHLRRFRGDTRVEYIEPKARVY